MLTEDRAADIETRLRTLYAEGEAEFGVDRVAELVAIGQGPLPDEADDGRSLKEMMWWRDALNIVGDEASPAIFDFYGRVEAAVATQGVKSPDELSSEIRSPLEAEGALTLRLREAAALFGFEL